MLNEFGKLIRKLRIDKNMKLGEMAGIINVSPAYLSAVENSKKALNHALVSKIAYSFDFTSEVQHEISTTGAQVIGEVVINSKNTNQANLDTAVMFARSVESSSLSEEKAKQIMEILKM
jgi:transcriptional regulator with XRE-family HTH domain